MVNSKLKPHTHVAHNLLVIDLQLDVQNDCDGLQQKFQHAEYFTCDPLITLPFAFRFSNDFHCYSQNVIAHNYVVV